MTAEQPLKSLGSHDETATPCHTLPPFLLQSMVGDLNAIFAIPPACGYVLLPRTLLLDSTTTCDGSQLFGLKFTAVLLVLWMIEDRKVRFKDFPSMLPGFKCKCECLKTLVKWRSSWVSLKWGTTKSTAESLSLLEWPSESISGVYCIFRHTPLQRSSPVPRFERW